jgi:hypothetical protein
MDMWLDSCVFYATKIIKFIPIPFFILLSIVSTLIWPITDKQKKGKANKEVNINTFIYLNFL